MIGERRTARAVCTPIDTNISPKVAACAPRLVPHRFAPGTGADIMHAVMLAWFLDDRCGAVAILAAGESGRAPLPGPA
jgi:hypothetical protein